MGVALAVSAAPLRAEWALSSGSGIYWYQPDAVNAAVDQFLGRQTADDDTGAADSTTRGTAKLGASVEANGPL